MDPDHHLPATDPLPATSHGAGANESVPALDLAAATQTQHDDSDSEYQPTSPMSPLSRSHSYSSQTSLSSSRTGSGRSAGDDADWDMPFPPLEKLNVFEFLDSLALPQRLEKLNRTVLEQRENLKKRREKVQQQYVRQKERVLKKRDVEFSKYRQKYGEQLDKIVQTWNDTRVVSTREKVAFVIGVANIFVTGYLMGGLPEWVHIWYSVQLLYFMPIRYYTYHKKGLHYFLMDLCYYTNLLLLLSLWVFPNSRRLMIATYCLSYGNNAWAIAMWRNSMVFHSLDKVTSLFIHLMPPVVFHTLVHVADPAFVAERFPAISRVKTTDRYGLGEMVIFATIPYAIWQLLYHFLITVRRREKIAAGRPTSFTWLRRSYAKTWIGKLVLKLPTLAMQEAAFMFIQYTYAVLTMLPCPFWFYHRASSALFISVVGIWSVYNGATYYLDVFGRRFEKELEQLKRDVAKWQKESMLASSPLTSPEGGAGATKMDGDHERRDSINRLAQLDDKLETKSAPELNGTVKEKEPKAAEEGDT